MKNPQATIPPDLALVGSFLFPENSANSQRVRTIASLLHTIGTKVKIGAANATPDLNPRLVSDEGIPVFHLSVFPDPNSRREGDWQRNLLLRLKLRYF